MIKTHRETLALIRELGGRNPTVRHGGKHTMIEFTNAAGKRHRLVVSKGNGAGEAFYAGRDRARLRRIIGGER